ncbi:putative O-glycosylation ligase, exosortase A system-associated [Sphingomonas sp.]|uniref:putative O-glycosylation ligase, exosortase A system-associated n=1 Tax=Sphingomonas sp. TaxID=28214 RepID=UPI002D7E797D|nr:putative O-glycosylation ligase, exosortase A system-associated [Sphingomonas sp.]HEU0043391.1 putative O-glycosylation ligase, exosortase A system-associated [Sphingomonas sp.]
MRDLAFLGFLLALFGLGFRRPFLLVLVYVYIDIVAPQRLTYYLLNALQISLVAVALAVGAWMVADDKRDTRVAPRQILIVLLLVYCGLTTLGADFPVEAKYKWDWVWKALAFAAFLPLTLRTKLRIEALLLIMVLSASAIVIVGGIKTLASGGGYGQLNLMVDNNAGLYEGSTISTVAIAIIPIIAWLARYGTIFPRDWRSTGFALALGFACLLIPIGTSTRTGLLCIALLAVLALRVVKRKLLYVSALGILALAAVPFLPSTFTERMSTIKTYQADESAATRVAVWKWTWEFAKANPFGGGFDAYRQNKIAYDLKARDPVSDGPKLAVDQGRAYHSAYFEMLGEQGYPGLALWLLMHLAGLWRMEVLRRRHRDGADAWAGSLAAALQSGHLVYLLGAAFIAIAFQPFIYMLLGAQIGLDTYLARKRSEATRRGFRRARPELAPA